MPKIVDKADKRRKIAQSTCNLFIQKGFSDLSISEIAKQAGVGKGTVYEYFNNKEDIVLELMDSFQEAYGGNFELSNSSEALVKLRIYKLFEIFCDNDKLLEKQRKIYKLFLAIHLNSKSKDVERYYNEFRGKYLNALTIIIEEAISGGLVKDDALKLTPSIFATIEGFFIEEESEQIIVYLDTLCELLKK